MQIADSIQDFSLRFDFLKASRRRAFTSHLAFSACIVAAVLAIVFFIWYPRPYFAAVGAWSIIRILVSVDLVLGPLLTLIVFKPGKRLLIVDVVFIAIIQVSALTYGLSVLYAERPLYNVFAIDRFHIFSAADMPADEIAMIDWLDDSPSGPVIVSARLPDTIEEQQRILEETVFGGAPDIEQRPSLWVPYQNDVPTLARNAKPLSLLRDAGHGAALDAALRQIDVPEDALRFAPMLAQKNDACVIVDIRDGSLQAVIDVDPWSVIKTR